MTGDADKSVATTNQTQKKSDCRNRLRHSIYLGGKADAKDYDKLGTELHAAQANQHRGGGPELLREPEAIVPRKRRTRGRNRKSKIENENRKLN